MANIELTTHPGWTTLRLGDHSITFASDASLETMAIAIERLTDKYTRSRARRMDALISVGTE